jgi:hypothetical protein
MKTFYLLSLIIVIASSQAFADNVYLRSGKIYNNAKVDTVGGGATIDMGEYMVSFQPNEILRIVRAECDPSKPVTITTMTKEENRILVEGKLKSDADLLATMPTNYGSDRQFTSSVRSNVVFIALGVLSAGIAWDKFVTGSDYTDSIDELNKSYNGLSASERRLISPPDVSRLESARTRSYIVGAVAAVAAITFTIYSLAPVKVIVAPNSVGLAYHF